MHTYTSHCGKCPFLAVPSHFSSASAAYANSFKQSTEARAAFLDVNKHLFCFRYDIHLGKSRNFGINKGFGVGAGLGIFQITTLGTYALAIW